MLVRLLREQRIRHKAGDTVEVSLADANFLISTGSAVPVKAPAVEHPEDAIQAEKRTTRKKTTR